MKLICPIAGVGQRLQPFTYSKPKAFLKLAGKRLIDHILVKLKRTFPIGTDIAFIVGYKKRQISEYIEAHYSDYFNLRFIEQKPLGFLADTPFFSGLGDAILLAKDFVKGDDCFIFLSDRLPMEDYSSVLLTYHQGDCDAVINIKKVDNPQFYGVTVVDEEMNLTKIVEKPREFISDYAVSGAYLFGKGSVSLLFKLLEEQSKVKITNGNEHQLTPIIERLINQGVRFKGNVMQSEILDFGRPESLLDGNRYLLSELKLSDPLFENLFQMGNIVDSKLIPPVFIGKNIKIKNSIIGPNVSIGDNLVLEKCILSESVIGDGVFLRKIISSNSIIGDYSILEDLIKKNITIGDSSYITTSKMKSF
ncbi:MAG: NDP-sugar synthase [Candidatus Lokiarchaeota archaeon]|nr:NDP-sugar synthase [Candidatus Lokiarchaeota archaeon]